MKKIITIAFATLFTVTLFAQVPNGVYVPKNKAAKALHFAKFEFTGGNKVRGHIGINGEPIGVVYEYIYTLNGNTLSLSEAGKNGSVEFTYDNVKNEISLLDGLFGTEGAIWQYKEGATYNPSANQQSVQQGNRTTMISGQSLNGIYVPVNEIAEKLQYAKFDFTGGNKVKGYIGMNGQPLGVAYEYIYTLNGNTLSLSEAGNNGSVEFTYDKDKDQIQLSTGTDSYPAAWGREGKKDCLFLSAPQVDYAPKTVMAGSTYMFRWKQVECASRYIVYWSFYDNNGTKKGEGNSGWTDKLEWTINVPDEFEVMYINVYAGDAYKGGEKSLDISVNVICNFDKILAETCALYSLLAYDETKVTNINYASLSSREYLQEYRDRIYKEYIDKVGNPYVYYTGIRGVPDYSPLMLQSQLRYDGYENIESKNYSDNDEHNISYTLAVKTENGNTQLAVILRGTDYVEWRGNMDVWKDKNTQGTNGRHYSFQKANETLQKAIKKYINDHKLKNINFLITGHSRGAAVANLLAVDLNERIFEVGEMKKIVAYTFATPNNTTNTKAYNNIFNFCFDDDFVPQVPLKEKWGFSKSGNTFTTTAQTLYYNDGNFKRLMDNYSSLSNNREPSFDKEATNRVMKSFLLLAPSVNIYYTKELAMAPTDGWLWEEKKTLHGFMRDYIANAVINSISRAGAGTVLKQIPIGNDVHEISDFFVDGMEKKQSVNDTHQAFTYYAALKSGGFSVNSIQDASAFITSGVYKDKIVLKEQSMSNNLTKPIISTQSIQPMSTNSPESTNNPVIQELATSTTQRNVLRIARQNGLVIGRNSSKGFANPEKCMIAVFAKDGTLEALFDVGGTSRTDLLSGQTVQNPEQVYNRSNYSLWYMQEKNN